jgi:Ca2+/Na+ antiporter
LEGVVRLISGERRLTPVARVVAPTAGRYVLAVAAAVVGLAIPFVVGAFPVLVILFSVIVLVLSFISNARQDPYKRMMIYPLVFAFTLPLLLNFGPITWMVTALVGCAFLGATLGRARRAAKQDPEVIPGPATDPMDVPGTTVATWVIGKDRFEELDPEAQKIDDLLVQLNDNFTVLTLRRGSARMDAVGFAPDAVEVFEADDVESAEWHTLLASERTMQGGYASMASSPDQLEGESLRRAQAAARYFAATGGRSPDVSWSEGRRAG